MCVNRKTKIFCDFLLFFCYFFGQFDQLTLTYNKFDSPLLSNFDDIGRTAYPLLLRPLLFPTLFAFPAFSALVLLSVFSLSFSCRRFFRSVLFCSAFPRRRLSPVRPHRAHGGHFPDCAIRRRFQTHCSSLSLIQNPAAALLWESRGGICLFLCRLSFHVSERSFFACRIARSSKNGLIFLRGGRPSQRSR